MCNIKIFVCSIVGFSTVAVNCLVDDSIGKGKKKEKVNTVTYILI